MYSEMRYPEMRQPACYTHLTYVQAQKDRRKDKFLRYQFGLYTSESRAMEGFTAAFGIEKARQIQREAVVMAPGGTRAVKVHQVMRHSCTMHRCDCMCFRQTRTCIQDKPN